jgi:predicted nucleic acid-binding protein
LTLYVDSSAFVKQYLDEPQTQACIEILAGDRSWLSGLHTLVEVRTALSRALRGQQLRRAGEAFARHWAATSVLELDATTCELAAGVGETLGVRALDALHIGAAQRAQVDDLRFLTYDRRQAEAARALGFNVVGV